MAMEKKIKKEINVLLYFFAAALLISGITAFPIEAELAFAVEVLSPGTLMHNWVSHVYHAYAAVNSAYPFLAYGTDWLAFAHLMLAILFWGATKDPVRNKWVVEFGIIACLAIIPLALIAGYIREIPLFWRCIDISFALGLVPLVMAYKRIEKLEKISSK